MKRVDAQRIYDNAVSTALAKRLPVKLPNLCRNDGKFTVNGLTFVFFASRLGEVGRKAELNRFLRTMRCDSTDPQPRHLGMQTGLNFLVKGCYHPKLGRVLKAGEYSLLDLSSTHPNAAMMHRTVSVSTTGFGRLKARYDHRCACCGSKEGDPHFKNKHSITTLDKGHCDPRKPLTNANCIPMCTICNMVYKNNAVFNKRGFIVRWLADDPKTSSSSTKASSRKTKAVVAGKRAAKTKDPAKAECGTTGKKVVVVGSRKKKTSVVVAAIRTRTMMTRSMTRQSANAAASRK